MLWVMLHLVFGERFVYGNWDESTTFNVANTVAAVAPTPSRTVSFGTSFIQRSFTSGVTSKT